MMNQFPILFNEADALLGRRVKNISSSISNTENAMQNILLEEMEKMEGILIATTNLHGNLDKAFDRRFLHKIKFHIPDPEIKSKIWRSKFTGMANKDYNQLANLFNFSGGQIDNVVRKAITYEILNGQKADFQTLFEYCGKEGLAKEEGSNVGFKCTNTEGSL